MASVENSTLKGRSFLKMLDFTANEISELLDIAAELKTEKKAGIPHKIFDGQSKNIALLFEKTSTRTRAAFEIAAADLGINAVFLDSLSSQMGKKESIKDTARVLGRMFDGIEYRGSTQENVDCLAKYSGVPVWNGLTDESHPTQILADLLTLREHFGRLKGLNFVFMGDAGFNMGNSLMAGCAIMGINFTACAPVKYFPNKVLIEQCRQIARESGAIISFNEDPVAATKNADCIYTDVWVSMGEPDEVWAERIKDLMPYQVNKALMQNAGENCVFMHCLPAFHDRETTVGESIYQKFGCECLEVTNEVFESSQSIVFDEAENRLHTIKAVIAATLI